MYKYIVSTFTQNDKKDLVCKNEYKNVREVAKSLDVSPATICGELNGKPSKSLKRFTIEKVKDNDALFKKMFKELMNLQTDEKRFQYLRKILEENLITSI